MTISSSALSSYQSPAAMEAERAMLVLKKQQDASKDEGLALAQLVQQSSPVPRSGRIDVYA